MKGVTSWFPHGSGSLADTGGGQVLLAQRGEVDIEFRVVHLGLDAGFVGAVLAEPVDVFGQVRRDVRQVFRVDLPSLFQQLADDLRDAPGNTPYAAPDDALHHHQ